MWQAPTSRSRPGAGAPWDSVGLRRLTLLSIYWVAIGWLWNALGAQVLPPIITRMVGHAHQGTALSALEGFGTLVAVVWQPVVGALSDRTRLRWGRRRPYIAGGALGSSLFLVIMAFVGAYYWLLIVYFLLQVASNTAQAPYQGLGPDAVPEKDFGRFGAFYGMGNLVGTLIGFVVTGIFTASGQYGRRALRDGGDAGGEHGAHRHPGARPWPAGSQPAAWRSATITVGTFQISPRRHGDFLWLMGSRLLILMGVVGLETYAQFFFKDVFYPHSTNHANAATTYLLAIIVVLAIAVCYPAARLSDRWGRKPMVIVCAILGALGALGLVFSHYALLPSAMTAPVASLLGIPRGLAQVLWFGVPIGVGHRLLPHRRLGLHDRPDPARRDGPFPRLLQHRDGGVRDHRPLHRRAGPRPLQRRRPHPRRARRLSGGLRDVRRLLRGRDPAGAAGGRAAPAPHAQPRDLRVATRRARPQPASPPCSSRRRA